MSNRTWACVDCCKSYRRDQTVATVSCAICGRPCEYVHWKLHIPSPKRATAWRNFWTLYRQEKRLIEQFESDPTIKAITLELLNQHFTRS